MQYNHYTIKDQMELIYEGNVIFDSGMIAGSHTVTRYIAGASTVVYVRMTGHDKDQTRWSFIVSCQLSDGSQVC